MNKIPKSILLLFIAMIAVPGFAAQPVAVSRQIEIAAPKPADSPTLKSFYYDPTVVSLGPAGYAVAWATDFATTDPHEPNLSTPVVEGKAFDLSGRQLGQFTASTEVTGTAGVTGPALARIGTDRFVSVYCQPRDLGADLWFRRFRSSTTAALDTQSVLMGLQPELQADCGSAIASNGRGRFVVAWMRTYYDSQGLPTSWSPFFQIFAASGAPLTSMIRASAPVAGTTLAEPAVGMDPAGNVTLVWYGVRGAKTGLWMRRFDATGVPTGDLRLLTTVNSKVAIVVEPDGDFVASWSSPILFGARQSLLLRRFGTDGIAKGPAVEIFQQGAGVYEPAMARDRSGNLAVFWIAGQGTAALALFDAKLAPIGPVAFDGPAAPAVPHGQSTRGGVAFGDDGRILTVWLRPHYPQARDSVLGQLWEIR
jgi:hypothetical protein